MHTLAGLASALYVSRACVLRLLTCLVCICAGREAGRSSCVSCKRVQSNWYVAEASLYEARETSDCSVRETTS